MATWQPTNTNWQPGQTPTDADANRWEGNTQLIYDFLQPASSSPSIALAGSLTYIKRAVRAQIKAD